MPNLKNCFHLLSQYLTCVLCSIQYTPVLPLPCMLSILSFSLLLIIFLLFVPHLVQLAHSLFWIFFYFFYYMFYLLCHVVSLLFCHPMTNFLFSPSCLYSCLIWYWCLGDVLSLLVFFLTLVSPLISLFYTVRSLSTLLILSYNLHFPSGGNQPVSMNLSFLQYKWKDVKRTNLTAIEILLPLVKVPSEFHMQLAGRMVFNFALCPYSFLCFSLTGCVWR